MSRENRITIDDLLKKKKGEEKITMLTAYDYAFGSLVDQAGIDIVLVGDSLANVVLGLESTKEVGMTEMLHHAKAVRRAVKKALLVGDMPYEAYQQDESQAVDNAQRFIEEAHCEAVKLEWFENCADVAARLVKSKIPVMGHVGLTPQTADSKDGFKVQGKEARAAIDIIEHAKVLEDKGCFSIVLECIPEKVAEIITQELSIPTIGIGAGKGCDGQVLVIHDLLGLYDRHQPKFVKQYVDLKGTILEGLEKFRHEVETGAFPDEHTSYAIDEEELKRIRSLRKS